MALSDEDLAKRVANAFADNSDLFEERPVEGASDSQWAQFLAHAAFFVSHSDEQLSTLPPQPAAIAPGVFLGGLQEAKDLSTLEALGVSCILNMAPCYCGPSSIRAFPEHFEVLDIDAEDADDYDIFSADVPTALAFLERCLNDGRRVLVHCFAGMNRSATVCAAWLLRQQKGSLSDIVMHLACTRGLVLQNTNFLEGLVSMARVEGLLIDSVSAAGG